ncbi:hypothetical protein NC652_040220 [Populus alba x Populus x berolinensis]|nr:hypothetical protein NC652_040220 [Populus alba x Populus x berolinensis]
MGICSQPDKPKSDPVPRFIDISAGDASFVSANSWLTAAKGSIQPLPWDIRLKVAVGIAQGLAYLHSPEVLVIHRDLRSSNILLDKFYNAKISDFGLASVLSPDDSRVETRDGHVWLCCS